MYATAKRLYESRSIAFLSIVSYFSCFYFIFHFLYTPIQGFQTPLELLLITASVYTMLSVLPRGKFGWPVVAAGILAVLAVFNHPISALILPVLGITLVVVGWRHLPGRKGLPGKIITLAFFAGLLLLIPVVTTQVHTEQKGVLALIPYMLSRYSIYATIFLRGFNRVLIPIPLVYLLARCLMARHAPDMSAASSLWIGILVSFAGAVLFILLPVTVSFVLLNVLVAAIAFTGWRGLFVALWFFAGALPNLTSTSMSGAYMRHPAIALSLLAGAGYGNLVGDLLAAMSGRTRRLMASLTLERTSVGLAVLAALAVLIAALHIAPVPVISKQVAQIEYLKNMGNNFRDTVAFLSSTMGKDTAVYFYRGPTSAAIESHAYTSTHLERLQPAKSNHYQSYFAISGRDDITVRFTDELPADASDVVIVATNNWEVRELESTFPLETRREFRRGTALARIYQLRDE
jgi:hypothetical protein